MSLAANIAVLLVVAVLLAATTGVSIWLILGRPSLRASAPWTVTDSFNFAKVVLAIIGGIGAVVALVIAYRKQKLGEAAERREESKVFAERFTKAAEQLGSDQAAIRLAGVYAFEKLAEDWHNGRQTCIDVLCAYLRMPYTPARRSVQPAKTRDNEKKKDAREEKQVRDTAIRVIAGHLREGAEPSWQGFDFDFTGATFDGGDFSKCVFSGGKVSFSHASFVGGITEFCGAKFSGADMNFIGLMLDGGYLDFLRAEFCGSWVRFGHMHCEDGNFRFHGAQFSGGFATFAFSELEGGEFDFTEAVFSGCDLNFGDVTFCGARVFFPQAKFTGGRIEFPKAKFIGGEVDFRGAEFTHLTLDFSEVADLVRPPLLDQPHRSLLEQSAPSAERAEDDS